MITALLFLFATAFYIPMYRIAQSKGYPGAALVRWTASYHVIVSFVLFLLGLGGITHGLLGLAYLPISLVLLVVQVLPVRRGAPGEKWHTITTTCQECQASIAFDRSRQGLVDSCPRCGEILTVPDGEPPGSDGGEGIQTGEDDFMTSPGAVEEAATGEWITLRNYASTALAEMDRQALEASGIPAVVQTIGAAGIFPTSLGTTLLVLGLARDKAESILLPWSQEE